MQEVTHAERTPQAYESKIVRIVAVRYTASETLDSDFTKDAPEDTFKYAEDGTLLIRTLEGVMSAKPGDWIIRGTEGEFYPCKDSVFRRKYGQPTTPPDTEALAAECDRLITRANEGGYDLATQHSRVPLRLLVEVSAALRQKCEDAECGALVSAFFADADSNNDQLTVTRDESGTFWIKGYCADDNPGDPRMCGTGSDLLSAVRAAAKGAGR